MVKAVTLAGPSLAAFEAATVARGVVVLDQMLKRSEVTVSLNLTLSPGRYLVLVSGGEAEIEEASDAASLALGEARVDALTLWDPHPELRRALALGSGPKLDEALALVETTTACAALHAAERCLKELGLHLLGLRLGAGLAGKGVFTLTGPLDAVEAARDVVAPLLGPRLVTLEVIPQPHPDLPSALLDAEAAAARP